MNHSISNNGNRKCFIVFLFVFSVLKINAQDYIIKHDKLTDVTTYYKVTNHKKDTVKVEQISLKKQSKISLNVVEYNPFYWNSKVTVYKNPVDESAGSSNVFNPFGLFAKMMGGFLPNNFPMMDILGENMRGVNTNSAEGKLNMVIQAYNKNYNQIKALSLQYNSFKNLEWQLNQLKFDIKRTEAEIKSAAKATVTELIAPEQLSPEKILITGNTLDSRTKEVTDSFVMLKAQLQQLSKTVEPETMLTNDKSAKDMLAEIEKGKVSVESFTEAAIAKPAIFTEQILTVGKIYNEIENTPFRYSYIVNSDPDITQLKLAMFSKVDSASTDTITKYFPIQNRNTIKLKNSLGLIFSYFGNDRSYFARPDSSIGQGKGNAFSPAIGTFINFYKTGQTGLKWGGALGFGLPLQGDIKEFQFLVGLSGIIGKNEPVIITIGAAGGKVNKLKNGWRVGDKIAAQDFNALTKSVYDIGGFFSISLNLSTLTQKK